MIREAFKIHAGRRRPHPAAPAGAGLGRAARRSSLVQLPDNCMLFKWITGEAGVVTSGAAAAGATVPAAALGRFFDGDVWHSFAHFAGRDGRRRCVASSASFCALFANVVAPHDPQNLATLELADARLPPAWMAGRQGEATCSAPTTRAATSCRR